MKIDQGSQILQLKKDQKLIIFWMFSSVSEKALSHKAPIPHLICCITYVVKL